MDSPEVRYARTPDGVSIAYQVFGAGPVDLVFVWGWTSNLDLIWDEPRAARFLHRLASFCRVISFDKRGTGLSDPVDVADPPHVETRLEDLRTVMEAAGSERAAILGFSEGGATAIMAAATHPELVSSLVLWGAFPRARWAPDYPWGETGDESRRRWIEPLAADRHAGAEEFFPDAARDPATRRWLRRYQLNAATPAMTLALLRMNGLLDVRDVLPVVRVPALVLHRTQDVSVRVEHGRYLAEHLPDATLVEYCGRDHWPWLGDPPAEEDVLRRIERHVTGSLGRPPPDRVLATVLFVDIVGSTRRLAAAGDRDWHASLTTFRELAASAVERWGGEVVNWTGDGLLATFGLPGRGLRCAHELVEELRYLSLEVRCGVHSGEIERSQDDIAGITVHTAARVCDAAQAGEVLVSQTVLDLVAGSGARFDDRGEHVLAGVPRPWRLHAVRSAQDEE